MNHNSAMKILHIVGDGVTGGAGRGAYWLHTAQRALGIDSTILTNGRDSLGDPYVICLAQTPLQKLKFFILPRLANFPARFYLKRDGRIFNTGFDGVDITKHPSYQSADIVHLHWINGLVSTRTIKRIDKPIVWTMRDMWPMTGGCHYSMECDRYTIGCGSCPLLGSHRSADLTRFIVAQKRSSLPKKMKVVGISQWLSDCAQSSRVFNGFDIKTISNNVDASRFFPISQEVAREILGLRIDQKVILVGAQRINDFYKGFGLLKEALESMRMDDVHLLVFGKTPADEIGPLGLPYTNLGFLTDTVSLRLAYSAADVFVAPSRMDAFGKTLAEAMACGTPVVCFDATGPKDIVDHQVTGYKARPFDTTDLSCGIRWVLDQSQEQAIRLRRQARERVMKHFDSRVIAEQYLVLYKQMLDQNG